MKSISTLILILVAAATNLPAQKPLNGDFEQWSNENTPENWGTANNSSGLLTTMRSSDAHSGIYAAMIRTQLYNGNIHGGRITAYSVPFTTALRSLNGWYKLKTLGTDIIRVRVTLHDKNNSLLDTKEFELRTIGEAWMSFSFPLDVEPDDGSGTGAAMVGVSFEIVAQGSMQQAGAVAIFDDIAFETAPATVGNETSSSSDEAPGIIHGDGVLRVHTSRVPAGRLHVVLYDMLGVEVLRYSGSASEGEDVMIPVDGITAGCYLITAGHGAVVRHEKIVLP